MNRSIALALCAALAGGLVAPPAAHAQSESDVELAKRHFELGRTYYDQGAYAKALEAFSDAYRLSKRAALLFNIARCHESLGQAKQAINQYQLYLDRTGKTDANITARIRNLKERVAGSEQPKPKPETPTPETPTPETPTPETPTPETPTPETPTPETPAPETPAPETANPTPPVPVAPPKTDRPSRWMWWTGWGLAGVGAASIGASIAFGVLAGNKADTIERAWADKVREWSDIQSIEEDGQRFQVLQIVTLAVGIAAAAGGVTMLVLAPKKRARTSALPSKLTLAPYVGPDGAGMGASVTF